MKYIIGIDIGTGSTKAVALDLSYQPVGSCQEHYPTFSPEPGYSEQDPQAIWHAFVRCINEMVSKMGSIPVAISLSSAMHSVIAVDANGEALAPMMTWADARSSDIAEQLRSSEAGMNIYRATGNTNTRHVAALQAHLDQGKP
jgi:gluconokinase